jgi:orotidine-5'-phosphate decarboxylase
MSFWTKYTNIIKSNKSYVCLGLDSELSKLPSHLLDQEDPIFAFNKAIIDQTKDIVACYKPNFAFYLSQGLKSLSSLQKTISYIPDHIPVILDIKAGDIGNTMANYAKAFFTDWGVDAITANPLMGNDVMKAIEPFQENFAFLLTLTSNPSAKDYLKVNELYKNISENINNLPNKQFGAVVGATNSQELRELRKLMPESLFLIPGIGAQGGSLRDVVSSTCYSKDDARFVINSSRGIIFADSSESFAQVAREKAESLRDQINKLIADL